jgi:hypothetical protein
MRRTKPRKVLTYNQTMLRKNPHYIQRRIEDSNYWDIVRNQVANKEKLNEEIFKRAFYKVKQRGSFNTNEFVSAFRHAEARGNINENNFVKHFLRRKTKRSKSHKNGSKTRKQNSPKEVRYSPKVVHYPKEVNLNALNSNEQMARNLQEKYNHNPSFLNRTKNVSL